MRIFASALAAWLLLLPTTLLADVGPNAGGTLILHATTPLHSDQGEYCGLSDLSACESAVTRVDHPDPVLIHVIAAFHPAASPRLEGLVFGVDYDPALTLDAWSHCADFELPQPDWPSPGSGVAVTWSMAETSPLVECYWFLAYDYAGSELRFELAPHPTQGGYFADDSVPAKLDPISGYGAIGFYTEGSLPCPGPGGACCLENCEQGAYCLVLTASLCDEAGGDWLGDDVPCDPNPCPPPLTGACCFEEGTCIVRTASCCELDGGVYLGDETLCEPNPCPQPPQGACCFSDGSCLLSSHALCTDSGGWYQGDNTLCEPNPCPQPPEDGACCLPDGACFVVTEDVCAQGGGDYQGDDTTCEPNPCPQPILGACCLANGDCLFVTQEACDQQGGDYLGDDTACDPNPCPQPIRGACCFQNGNCVVMTEEECIGNIGWYQGDDTDCDPNPCPQPIRGACCFPDGTCVFLTEDECSAGTYLGDDVPCQPNPCPQPSGACCFPDDTCIVLQRDECDAQGGQFEGADVPCEPNPCVDIGACCFADGHCEVRTRQQCEGNGGVYVGNDVPCVPNPCGAGGGCSGLRPWEERVALIRQVREAQRNREGAPVEAQVGPGSGVLVQDGRPSCGDICMNADGSYENGYAWQYGGVVAPEYGAFAEVYATPNRKCCSVILDLTQTGNAAGGVCDVYAWADAAGIPGAVLGVTVGFAPTGIAFWPSASRHAASIDARCANTTWVGYWGNWPGQFTRWYVGADLDGFGGCPYTNIAPGIGYPTGWNNVSIVWGPTQALGIGAELIDCGSTPIHDSSWGRIKALFR